MARIDVLMPQMGESIAEGTLSKWLKKLGDEVKRDEPLFEISTDKVDAEIPAPSAGKLVEIKVQEGQTVPVQTLVAVLETDKDAAVAKPAAAAAAPAAQKPEPPPSAPVRPSPSPSASVPAPVRPCPSPSGRGLARRPRRADVQDPQDHGGSHGSVAAHLRARDQLLRGRLLAHRGAARQEQGVLRRARRQPHLSRVHRQGMR